LSWQTKRQPNHIATIAAGDALTNSIIVTTVNTIVTAGSRKEKIRCPRICS
jgi:hypothetical protein